MDGYVHKGLDGLGTAHAGGGAAAAGTATDAAAVAGTAPSRAGATEQNAARGADLSASPAAIELRGVSFSYPAADGPVLEDLDWTVPAGAFALLVGGTGSGKSTLLSLLKPQIAPAGELAGKVHVFGEPVCDMGDRRSAETVGYLFQDPENQIVCENVWHEMAFGLENLGTPQDEMRRRVAETSYFFGLEDWLHAETDTLSGGRKQLLSLAAILALRPRLLLLDEPTSMLDPIAEKNFLHALFRANHELGCTVVVATHQPRPMLDYATCAYELEGGALRKVPDFAAFGAREPLFGANGASQSTFFRISGQNGAKNNGFGAQGCPDVDGKGQNSANCSPNVEKRVAERDVLDGLGTQNVQRFEKMSIGIAANVKDGWFRYDRAAGWVLRGLSAGFAAGQVHAVVGGNGCGKSTLLSILAQTRKLQRGRCVRAAKSAALLPQNPKALLVGETVQEELAEWSGRCGYGASEIAACLWRMGLAGFEGRHPYDLSGGQRQLLALGKLLLIGPELLLLDEPTKGLDLASRRTIAAALRAHAASGGTVIMATHDLDFAEQVADDVSMMFDGELACTEPAQAFFATNMFYRP